VTSEPRQRLGVAVEVGEPARAALAKAVEPLRAAYPGVHWVDADRWYIEICALGAVEAERAPDLDEVAHAAARGNARLMLRLDGGAWIEVGCTFLAGVCPSEPLVALRDDLIRRLDKAGLPAGRDDSVLRCVIGRTVGGARLPPSMARSFEGPMVTWTARRLLVVRTRLRLGGVAHEVRSAHDFGLPVAALT
jgi:2'-5' RNA ligase